MRARRSRVFFQVRFESAIVRRAVCLGLEIDRDMGNRSVGGGMRFESFGRYRTGGRSWAGRDDSGVVFP